jgi:nucleoside-diphosphate-sugar epimerase
MDNRVLFIGGPGNLSASAIRVLHKKGYQVAVYSNPGFFDELDPAIKTFAGNRDDTSALQRVMEDYKPDVVLDFVLFVPEQASQMMMLVEGKVRQYVFISTVDVYGYPLSHLPFREDDPWNQDTQSPYAENKRECDALFRARFHPTRFPLTIARPAYSFGPRFILSFMSRDEGTAMLRRLKDGRPIMVPGDGTTLMHVSAAENTGCMIAALVDARQAIGKDYTVGHPTFTTHDGYVKMLATALGVEPNIVHIPTDFITSINRPDIHNCLLHALTRFNVAFSIDRFLRDFPEFAWGVTLEEWSRYVVQWNLQHKTLDGRDKQLVDDEIIESWTGSWTHLTRLLSVKHPN